MKINVAIEHLRQCRKNQIALLEKYADKIHVIPNGFKNNLNWNATHNVVTQQLLCYRISGLPTTIEEPIIEAYRKGSSPTEGMPTLELPVLKELMLKTVDQIEIDIQNNLFQTYKEYPTSFGVVLNSFEDAVLFNNIHESLHFGYMMALCKSL